MTLELLVTDRNMVIQGDPIDGWTSLDCTRRFNEPASGTVELPARPEVMAQLQPGTRIIVIRDGAIWMAGPLEIPQDFIWSISDEGQPDPGKVSVAFTDDLAVPAGYLTWPLPASAWSAQPASASREIATANAETIIRTLVNEQCGPGAQSARRIPHFALAPPAGVGATTTLSTRFEGLLAACRRVALNGGNLGFRTRQDAAQILFDVYAPADKTATARFSAGLGNLRSVGFKMSAPTVTHALVSGNEVDPPASRAFVQAADAAAAAAWWRVEQHVDGGGDNDTTGELTVAGRTALAEGSAPVELSTTTVDTPDLMAGRDFDLGDRVTVELPTGLEVTDIVRNIHLQATPTSGEYVSTLIGSPESSTDPQTVRLIRDLSRRLGRLEAR
ncbi:siphovirus ReqiPepy6 Gp37-like family protein [Streptomyces corynorhini]|uniref:Gp28/Gp37-like domain-containing protein n=1 Tax=Streptomyces corynorhini TaxID=2282652 RepID=A0A370BC61_9ACTN|nr:siphovirus ReqiPepy6 Gp37-like family protein [Streptomyces corynorhini]RDG37969.1 hypothetical protein DVH02_11640 [Streptomyces corynorhini]